MDVLWYHLELHDIALLVSKVDSTSKEGWNFFYVPDP